MAYNNPFMSYQQPIQNPYMTGYPQQQPVQQTPVYYGLRGELHVGPAAARTTRPI